MINYGIIAPGHGREVVDGLIITEKNRIFHLMDTVKMPYSKRFGIQMGMYTSTQNAYVSLAK